MKFIPYLFLSIFMLSLSGCEKVFIQDPATNPRAIFQETWDYVDRYYSYFDYKNIDWDSVYQAFEPRITDELSEEELFQELSDMLFLLRDGHVNLESDFNISRYSDWYLNYPTNFDLNVIERTYTAGAYEIAGPFLVWDFGDVGYVYYGSFSRGFNSANLNYIVEKFADKKGLIIDVRDNGGGSLESARLLAQRFVSERTLVGRNRKRNGPGRDDFTPWVDRYLEPQSPAYSGPVVVLTNRSCYSSTNYFIQYMRSLEQVTIVGDRSGGGAGTPSYTELANGWILRVSASQFQDQNGIELEGGIDPDHQVDISPEDKANEIDSILEFALDLF